ncbi:hypothetical protein NC796_13855 [Aliifodinibius sp. S!AR15-10]|uniref:hypothetical protein n=1 Tax=Aliifodinibius sp. S!AR15-10 TaxID=2950437 RepID=UPI002858870A|nr:hypothetical protein [Aliifodinibius sp. S!AR15-10]MDR8392233.1 hypothetical protein [Aliifodinibius sp. S!AR15-10]
MMTNDVKDRHVAAAAVREKLDMIITFNLKDFGDEHLKKWNVKAVHPQDYLLILCSMKPAVFMTKLSMIAQKRGEDLETVVKNPSLFHG